MVKETKSFRLMGSTITVSERYEGEFESEKRFIETNKHLFKYHGVKIDERQRIHPELKLPGNVISAIVSAGGSFMEFLMGKTLEKSDVEKNQNRLYVPKNSALLRNLKDDEKETIEREGKEGGLEVIVMDRRAVEYTCRLKIWRSFRNSNKYVLIKEWAKLVLTNGLRKDDLVEIWCFRADSKLRLFVNAELERREG